MTLTIALTCAALLLTLVPMAISTGRSPRAITSVYGPCLALSAVSCLAGIVALVSGAVPETLKLPMGLPWLGANFRLDALAAFFLVVVNLGAAATSLFALGYGRHEQAPMRVLPFYPAFLAGMNLVILADDAFSFLVAWEFMSLTSWALVMARR